MITTLHIPTAESVVTLDALNRFVRSPSAGNYHGIQSAVYAMKDCAIRLLDEAGLLVRRPIVVRANCRMCHGKGALFKWDWWTKENYNSHCHICCGGGKINLYFKECKIIRTLFAADEWAGPDITWHSPIRMVVEPFDAEPVTDWKPRTPGRDMTPEQVAEALNIAEPEFWDLPYESTHTMYLGKLAEECAFCKYRPPEKPTADEGLIWKAPRRGRLFWFGAACRHCDQHYNSLRSLVGLRCLCQEVFSDFPTVPPHLPRSPGVGVQPPSWHLGA